ncbi:hypothetical protein G6F50_017313 [Rhizopus delemar]|uniref:Uncharacterized protein n=1 Tax=Rhizopus delemar TaxID=936053 RepID=A0A9P6XR01_9FUNG|nr:hypothetical protein G6F50_017313 [Rhizopus delemar]
MRSAGAGERRDQAQLCVFRCGGQAQYALQLVLVAARGIDRRLCSIQRLHAVLQELFAGLGQGQVTGTAQQQGHAQLLFQSLQVEADHRAAQAEAVGRRGQAAGLDHGAEDLEAIEADHGHQLSKQI